jgi:predicted DNA-binding protein (UPF0251 family)
MKNGIPKLTEWVTATDAAAELGLARQSVNKMIALGRFQSVHVLGEGKGIYVIGRHELEAVKAERLSEDELVDS